MKSYMEIVTAYDVFTHCTICWRKKITFNYEMRTNVLMELLTDWKSIHTRIVCSKISTTAFVTNRQYSKISKYHPKNNIYV